MILTLQSCARSLQAPFAVEDPTIKGRYSVANGAMIASTKDRYWLSYRNSLEKAGYTVRDGSTEESGIFFQLTSLDSLTANKEANFLRLFEILCHLNYMSNTSSGNTDVATAFWTIF